MLTAIILRSTSSKLSVGSAMMKEGPINAAQAIGAPYTGPRKRRNTIRLQGRMLIIVGLWAVARTVKIGIGMDFFASLEVAVHGFMLASARESLCAPVHESLCMPVHESLHAPAHESLCAPMHEFMLASVRELLCAPVHECMHAPAHECMHAPAHKYVHAPVHKCKHAPCTST